MRLAWVVTGGFDRSGRERVIPILLTIVERLARRHDVHVFVLRYAREPDTYPLVGATVHDLGRPAGLRRQRATFVRALDAHGPFDLLHAYWAMPAGLVGAMAARQLHVPCVVSFSSGEFVAIPEIGYGLQRRLATRFAVRATARLATRTIVDTEFMTGLARLQDCNPLVLPLGVDTRQFVPPPERTHGPPWRLLHVASLNLVKDQAVLLHALRRVLDRVSDVHLDIVGEDTLGGELQRLAAELRIDTQVTFHGFQPSDAVIGFYQRAHLHVMSSRHEAAGVAVLEAAACGIPTVATRVGYVADWSPDRALAVAVGDSAALADAIVALLQNPERHAAMAAAARQWTLAHDADWSVGRLEQLYLSCTRGLQTAP